MLHIITTEWKGLARSKSTLLVLLILAVALIATTLAGIQSVQTQNARQQQANQTIRAQWDGMDPKNPHNAAHFGSYVVKPTNPISAIDPGINALVGNVLRLEAHKQNESAYSAASQSLMPSKFGALTPAIVLQVIVPILLIFLVYRAISSEKEGGRIKVLAMQGLSVTRFIKTKALAYWLLAVVFLAVILVVQWAIYPATFSDDLLIRSLSLFLAYAVYFLIICLLAAYLAIRLKNAAGLTTTIAIWVLWTIFLPKLFGSLAEAQQPLPSRHEFQANMREDRSKGIDGHNPADQRQQVFEDSVLLAYNVTTVDSLPINIDGLLMQADEEYGNQVWDKHFKTLYEVYQRQKQLYQLGGLVNPFGALQSVSMGTAGADNLHRIDFLQQAETYRRGFIRMLNLKHAFGGSKSGDWGWKADQAFFQSVPDFDYKPPRLSQFIGHYLADHLVLLAWLLLTFVLVHLGAKNYRFV